MIILSDTHKIAFFIIPKIASTTVRLVMYEVIHGKPFEPDLEKGIKSIYFEKWTSSSRYNAQTGTQLETYAKFAIIRDPFQRLYSAYKFLFPNHQNRQWMKDGIAPGYEDINLAPDFEAFLTNFDDYKKASKNIAFHVQPYHNFLGPSLDMFSTVFRLEEMDKVSTRLSEIVKKEISFPHSAKSANPNRLKFEDLSDNARQIAAEICADDYALCKDYYQPA